MKREVAVVCGWRSVLTVGWEWEDSSEAVKSEGGLGSSCQEKEWELALSKNCRSKNLFSELRYLKYEMLAANDYQGDGLTGRPLMVWTDLKKQRWGGWMDTLSEQLAGSSVVLRSTLKGRKGRKKKWRQKSLEHAGILPSLWYLDCWSSVLKSFFKMFYLFSNIISMHQYQNYNKVLSFINFLQYIFFNTNFPVELKSNSASLEGF